MKPETKKWVNVVLLTLVIPQLLNLIARGYKSLGKLAVDYNFMTWTTLMTFGIFVALVQNKKLAENISSFGKDIESTGTTLALLIPTFLVSFFINYKLLKGQIYIHYI
jgi:hypothetical protein